VSKLQIIGLSTLILSHLLIAIALIVTDETQEFSYIFYIAWAIGIISVVSNILFADKIRMNSWLIGIFGICGILWFFPFLLITYFGIPFMVIFLVIGIYIHRKAFVIQKKTKETL